MSELTAVEMDDGTYWKSSKSGRTGCVVVAVEED